MIALPDFGVFVGWRDLEFLKKELEKPPEVCGNATMEYVGGSYYLTNFREEYTKRSSTSCSPCTRPLGAVWHTHPPGLQEASEVDFDVMRKDIRSALASDIPGVPPLNLVVSNVDGEISLVSYVPTLKLDMGIRKVPHILCDVQLGTRNPTWKSAKKHYVHFLLFRAEEKEDPISGGTYWEVTEFSPYTCDEGDFDGVFVGSRVPPHVVPIVIAHFARVSGERKFLMFLENRGLFEVELKSVEENIVRKDVGTSTPDFGYESRIRNLRGIDLEKLRNFKIAVFGAGFLGSSIVGALAKYFGEITVVDVDYVGRENVGYQEYYSPEDVDEEKAYVLARRIEGLHPQVKVYGVRAEVPGFDEPKSRVLEKVVSWADCVVTTFDNVHSRLAVQVACSRYSKPNVDVGANQFDGRITVWLPRKDYACPGCYTYFDPSRGPKTVYSADPTVARAISSWVAKVCVDVALGRKVPNCIYVDFSKSFEPPKVENRRKEEFCPFCSERVELEVEVGDGVKLLLEEKREKTIQEFEEHLREVLGEGVKVEYIMSSSLGENNVTPLISKGANLVFLKTLSNFGMRMVARR